MVWLSACLWMATHYVARWGMEVPMKSVIGIALGSGGAKGFAHVGVLKALEECDIPVDVVSGSSMGSLVGAFYVTGMKSNFMERLARTLTWRHWVDVTVPRVGLITGKKVHELVALLTHQAEFASTELPFAVVATELVSRQLVTFRSGSVADAVRASISIPGVFVPFVKDDAVYVDGGVMERVPVAAARDLGATSVIAIDVAANRRHVVPETMMDVISMSLDAMQEPFIGARVADAAVVLRPDLSEIGTSQFSRAGEAIDIGYRYTMEHMDEIRASIESDSVQDIAH